MFRRERILTPAGAQFIGDIGQPLHVEAYKLGGNQIGVACSGTTTNLHAVCTVTNVGPYYSNLSLLDLG